MLFDATVIFIHYTLCIFLDYFDSVRLKQTVTGVRGRRSTALLFQDLETQEDNVVSTMLVRI